LHDVVEKHIQKKAKANIELVEIAVRMGLMGLMGRRGWVGRLARFLAPAQEAKVRLIAKVGRKPGDFAVGGCLIGHIW